MILDVVGQLDGRFVSSDPCETSEVTCAHSRGGVKVRLYRMMRHGRLSPRNGVGLA